MTQRYVERTMDLGLVQERRSGARIGRAVGGVFVLIGLGVAGWGVVLLREAQASSGWPSVTGRVTDVRVESNTRKGKTRYKPLVRYEYEVDGRVLAGQRVRIPDMSATYSSRVAAERVYALGAEVPVWYDPANPERAVLQPGVGWQNLLVPAIGAVVGLLGAVLAAAAGRKRGDGVSPVMR